MVAWKVAMVALVVLLPPVAAGAAPTGKVVLAQGVDPTTLDMANQSETPASNVGRHGESSARPSTSALSTSTWPASNPMLRM